MKLCTTLGIPFWKANGSTDQQLCFACSDARFLNLSHKVEAVYEREDVQFWERGRREQDERSRNPALQPPIMVVLRPAANERYLYLAQIIRWRGNIQVCSTKTSLPDVSPFEFLPSPRGCNLVVGLTALLVCLGFFAACQLLPAIALS
jgi:hypothetical protein